LLVRSALAPLRGFPSRYRGGSNVRRPSRVHGDRWQSCSHSQFDGVARYQRYQFKYQQAQQRPPGTTQGHTGPSKYHQKASKIPCHTPRTKAAGASRSTIAAAVVHMKATAGGQNSGHDAAVLQDLDAVRQEVDREAENRWEATLLQQCVRSYMDERASAR